jgi:PAS domain S-box-containing protein
MPFSPAFKERYLVERVLKARQNPVIAYGTTVILVAVATLIRWAVGGSVIEGLPFITYYPAIVLSTLIGGFWPGILSVVLSAGTAGYLFLPPLSAWPLDQHGAVSLLLFAAIGGINVALVSLLNAAVDHVMAQEQNVRVLIESAPNGIVVVDELGIIKLVNASTETLFGYGRSELLGKKVEVLVPDRKVDEHQALRESFLQAPETRMMGVGRDLSGRRKDGSTFPVEIGLNLISRNGNSAVLATVIDITAHKRALESDKLIIRELQHRTQNLFAVFEVIAARSVDEGKTAAEIKYALNGRLRALARAYTMLADAAWEGASLARILHRQLAGFGERVNIGGCDIVLAPSATQQFAMIVHELATNALKYGALSTPTGRISIEGKIDRLDRGGTFSFAWKEVGGPPATPPTRKGFGSIILLDTAKQFAESVDLDYTPQGLSYKLQLQISVIQASSKHPTVHELRATSLC